MGIWAPPIRALRNVDGQLVPSGKAYTHLTGHLITG